MLDLRNEGRAREADKIMKQINKQRPDLNDLEAQLVNGSIMLVSIFVARYTFTLTTSLLDNWAGI